MWSWLCKKVCDLFVDLVSVSYSKKVILSMWEQICCDLVYVSQRLRKVQDPKTPGCKLLSSRHLACQNLQAKQKSKKPTKIKNPALSLLKRFWKFQMIHFIWMISFNLQLTNIHVKFNIEPFLHEFFWNHCRQWESHVRLQRPTILDWCRQTEHRQQNYRSETRRAKQYKNFYN